MKPLIPILSILLLASCTKVYYTADDEKLSDSTASCCCCCPCDSIPTDSIPQDTLKVWPTHDIIMYATPTTAQYYNDVFNLKKAAVGGDTSSLGRSKGGPVIFISNSRGVHWYQSYSFYATFADYPIIDRSYGGAQWQNHALFARDLTNTDEKAKQIILKSGENELDTKYSPTWFHPNPVRYDANKPWIEFLFYNYKNTLDSIRKYNPTAVLTYATMDLSPKFVEAGLTADVQAINSICKQILATYANTSVIELENVLSASDYTTDKLHWTANAYAKIAPIIKAEIIN